LFFFFLVETTPLPYPVCLPTLPTNHFFCVLCPFFAATSRQTRRQLAPSSLHPKQGLLYIHYFKPWPQISKGFLITRYTPFYSRAGLISWLEAQTLLALLPAPPFDFPITVFTKAITNSTQTPFPPLDVVFIHCLRGGLPARTFPPGTTCPPPLHLAKIFRMVFYLLYYFFC